jgi:hypothetical protein
VILAEHLVHHRDECLDTLLVGDRPQFHARRRWDVQREVGDLGDEQPHAFAHPADPDVSASAQLALAADDMQASAGAQSAPSARSRVASEIPSSPGRVFWPKL